MGMDGFTGKLEAVEATGRLRTPEGEEYGPRLVYAAILQVLQFAVTKPSPYAMAREILTTGMLVPQECKGAFINGLASLYVEKGTDSDEWRKFRVKLQGLLLKQLGLVQAAEILLQDWQIEEPTLKQMELFTQAGPKTETVNMTTGEVQ
jgi:hypothetical protein